MTALLGSLASPLAAHLVVVAAAIVAIAGVFWAGHQSGRAAENVASARAQLAAADLALARTKAMVAAGAAAPRTEQDLDKRLQDGSA